jgi:hypothetical protein
MNINNVDYIRKNVLLLNQNKFPINIIIFIIKYIIHVNIYITLLNCNYIVIKYRMETVFIKIQLNLIHNDMWKVYFLL